MKQYKPELGREVNAIMDEMDRGENTIDRITSPSRDMKKSIRRLLVSSLAVAIGLGVVANVAKTIDRDVNGRPVSEVLYDS